MIPGIGQLLVVCGISIGVMWFLMWVITRTTDQTTSHDEQEEKESRSRK